jgi:hypothetical protein
MLLNRRRKELIKKAMSDYAFMSRLLTNEIAEVQDTLSNEEILNKLSDLICKIKGTEITNLETYEGEGYLDFNYNNVNMSVAYNDKPLHVSNTFEIYDDKTCEYVIEDWETLDWYAKYIETPREQVLADAVVDLKFYESNNHKLQYDDLKEELINFIKEEW